MSASVTVTERAAARIAQIASNDPENNMLRVSVEGGGPWRLRGQSPRVMPCRGRLELQRS